MVTAFFFISLGVNAIVTALIVYRIIIVYNDIRGPKSDFQHGNGLRVGQRRDDINPLISILIESGLITFVAQLALSVMYKYANVAFPLVSGIVVMLYVRSNVDLVFITNVIYLLHREFRRQLSLCVSRWAFLRSCVNDCKFNESGSYHGGMEQVEQCTSPLGL
jgi:hypothetical protein